jgi:predicted SAM-dependent methyltransferase
VIRNFIKSLIGRLAGFRPPAAGQCELSREGLAARYLSGDGIEIGALHMPLLIPASAKVRYLDRMSEADARKHYPELIGWPLVHVDIIDDGEKLETVKDLSLDFVIANHFLEHCQNPIYAVSNMLRVLKKRGVLFLTIPDMRFTFDKKRPVTPIEHLVKDYREGPENSRRSAFEEYVRCVDGIEDPKQAGERVKHYMDIDYSIHFHAWTEFEMLELLAFLKKDLAFVFDVEMVFKRDYEIIMILRRGP